MNKFDLNADIIPGCSAAGFHLGAALDDCEEILSNAVSKDKNEVSDLLRVLHNSDGVLHILDRDSGESTIHLKNDVIRLKFNSRKRLYCIYMFEQYLGAFNGSIRVGAKLSDVSKYFPIYYDEGDEIHYPDDERGANIKGIGFCASEESLEDNPQQLISGISIHDWSLQD